MCGNFSWMEGGVSLIWASKPSGGFSWTCFSTSTLWNKVYLPQTVDNVMNKMLLYANKKELFIFNFVIWHHDTSRILGTVHTKICQWENVIMAPCCTILLQLHHCHKGKCNIYQKWCPTGISTLLECFVLSNNNYIMAILFREKMGESVRVTTEIPHYLYVNSFEPITWTFSCFKAVLVFPESISCD